MKIFILCIIMLILSTYSSLAQHTFYVNNVIGNDGYTGLIDTVGPDGINGPKKTIANAVVAANAGDSIKIVFTNVTYIESNIQVSKNLNFYAYGSGNILIDFSAATTGFRFTMPGTTTFSSAGSQRIILRGSSHVGFNLVSGKVFLNNSTFIIQPPFLFQNDIINTSADPVTTWFVDSLSGNYNFSGLSQLAAPPDGPLPNIFHVYSKISPPFESLANDRFNITPGEYTDAPVILKNIIINGQQNTVDRPVVFNLVNTDLHFSMPGRTIFQWQNSTTNSSFRFKASPTTGMVFKSGCVEFRDVPFEINPPFLFKTIPSYCDVTPPNIPPIPLVVYGDEHDTQVYHTIGLYYTDQNNVQHNKCWLKENLNIGEMIPGNMDQTNDNGHIQKYCYWNNIDQSGNPFDFCRRVGGLYQWAEALQYINGATNTNLSNPPEIVKGICPEGWHISTYPELGYMEHAVNYDANAAKAIGTGVQGYTGFGTNTSGFTAELAGWRNSVYITNPAIWNQFNGFTFFLSTKEYAAAAIYSIHLNGYDNVFGMAAGSKANGISVRCVNDIWVGSSGALYTDVSRESHDAGLTNGYSIEQNYPNPFNPATTIVYEVLGTGHVKIDIFDITGKFVRELVNKDETPGKRSVIWDGRDFNGIQAASGAYFYNIKVNGKSQTKKMILLK